MNIANPDIRPIEDKEYWRVTGNFTNLVVWQKAHQLVLNTYGFTRRFPDEEADGLTLQVRQSAIDATAYISRASQPGNVRETLLHFSKSLASVAACKYFLLLAQDLRFGDCNEMIRGCDEIAALLEEQIRYSRNNLSLNL